VRPVNLIPPEERGEQAPIRTGPMAYLLVGALALALGAMLLLVVTNNKITDRKAEVASLTQQEAAAKAESTRYAAFQQFAGIEKQRHDTIASLADTRFDWPRVLRELALVIPGDVGLVSLTGMVSPGVSLSGSGGSSSAGSSGVDTSSITGPSLQLSGCATSQDAVARFLAALRDIDGVTRVGLASSGSGSSGSSGAGASGCDEKKFRYQFQAVASFDAVPAPPVPGAAPSTTPTTPTTPAPQSSGSTTSPTPASATAQAAAGGNGD